MAIQTKYTQQDLENMAVTKETMMKYMVSRKAFAFKNVGDVFEQGVNAIYTDAPYKMKLIMAASEFITFASQLRKAIQLDPKTLVTVNTITMLLSQSGSGKDAAMKMIRNPLIPAYDKIAEYRKELAREQAEAKAIANGKEAEDWYQFYSAPRELFAGISTLEGTIKHLASIESGRLGAGYLQVSEIASDLQSSKDLIPNIEALSLGYDLGAIPSKIVKSDENQIPSIKGLPFSGLLFGSFDIILYDEAVKTKFDLLFKSKLSRRTTLHFNTELSVEEAITDIDNMDSAEEELEAKAIEAQLALEPWMTGLVDSTTQEPLGFTKEAKKLYRSYKKYNTVEFKLMSKLYPLVILSRAHAHWRALKVAAALAILNGRENIEEEDMIHAINFTELYSDDLKEFEMELAKEQYELFADYMHSRSIDGTSSISAHAMRKLGYIPKTGRMENSMTELVKWASTYDADGIYSVQEGNSIHYELIQRTDIIGCSWRAINNDTLHDLVKNHRPRNLIQDAKSNIAASAVTGYEYAEGDFASLASFLNMDVAFTPFRLTDGTRGKDNTHGAIKWVCLDIDDSKITDEEAHAILSSINHHIARTSDPENAFKFRIILELDASVEVTDKIWKYFIESLKDYLSINIDPISRSHIVFGYSSRNVLSVTDQYPVEAKEHIMYAHSAEADKPERPPMTDKQKKTALGTPFSTYGYAFEAEQGEGSRKLIAAAYHAKELGANNHEIIELLHEINNYWEYPMPQNRLDTTILSQVRRF